MRILAWPAFVNRRNNPYNWLLYTHMKRRGVQVDEFSLWHLLRGKYAIWHLHWPESLMNFRHPTLASGCAVAFLRLLDAARARGTRIVWTIHNLAAHDSQQPFLERWFWRHFMQRIDGYICLTEGTLERARQRFPALVNVPGFVVPHGHYRQIYKNRCSREKARNRLDISPQARVILYFGQIRPYKNIGVLLKAFGQFLDPDAVLVIAGKASSPALQKEIVAAASSDPRVRLWMDFIPPRRVQYFFNVADLVVLPYRDVLNSGSALLALSFNRAVLVPDLGAMGELKTQVGADWVCTYPGELNETILSSGLAWGTTSQRASVAPLGAYDWDEIARLTLNAYWQVWSGRYCLPHSRDTAVGLDTL
jgi:glycosyltransferase involved in cell wall biosynthesis